MHTIFDPQGRQKQVLEMPYVEITIDGEEEIIDVGDRVFRMENNYWINAIVPLSSDEMLKLSTSTSVGLRFRYTNEAPIFLGIEAMPILEAREQLSTILRF